MFAGRKLVVIYFHKVPHLGPKIFQVTGLLRLHPSSGKPPDESRFGEFVEQFRVFFFSRFMAIILSCVYAWVSIVSMGIMTHQFRAFLFKNNFCVAFDYGRPVLDIQLVNHFSNVGSVVCRHVRDVEWLEWLKIVLVFQIYMLPGAYLYVGGVDVGRVMSVENLHDQNQHDHVMI